MKITKLEAYAIKIPTIRPHKMAIGTVSTVSSVIIRISTDEGILGFGEAASAPFFSEECQEASLEVLKNYLGPAIIGLNPLEIQNIYRAMNKSILGNPFSKAGVEIAAYDIAGKALGVPVHTLLGGPFQKSIPLSWSLATGDAFLDIEEAKRFMEKGMKIFKIKAGVLDPKSDLERIEKIREALGDAIDLRVDANQGWNSAIATRIIKSMDDYNISFVEQPVPKWDLHGLAKVTHAVETPILIDEGLFTPQDALRVIELGGADIFGIKVMKHGGIFGSKFIVKLAKEAGIPCYLGARIRMSVGAAASLQVGVSEDNFFYGCEEFSQTLLKDIIIKEPLKIEDGEIYVPEGNGLGIELDLEKLQKYTVKYVEIC